MPKWGKILFISVAILIALWAIARITGMLQMYKIPTPSGEPNIHVGHVIWTSNLKKPKHGDIITYTSTYLDSINNTYGISNAKNVHYLHRLCAMENDVIEMKDNVFFVNGVDFDSKLDLFHFYKVKKADVPVFTQDENGQPKDPNLFIEQQINDSFSAVNLSKSAIKQLPTSYKLEFYIKNDTDTSFNGAFKWYDNNKRKWSANNFGPLTIPKGCGFVLGDNRDNSMDSRYTGFIKLSNIKGVKL